MEVLALNITTRVLQSRKVLDLPFYTPTVYKPMTGFMCFLWNNKCWSIIELGPDLLTSEPAKKISQDV